MFLDIKFFADLQSPVEGEMRERKRKTERFQWYYYFNFNFQQTTPVLQFTPISVLSGKLVLYYQKLHL